MVRARDLLRAFLASLEGVNLAVSSLYLALWILAASVKIEWISVEHIDIPAIANHAHALGFGKSVEFGTVLQILLAANTLSVAETGFG